MKVRKRGPVKRFKERFTISLAGKQRGSLMAIARREDRSVSSLVRRAVEEFLERSEAGKQ